MDISVNRLYIFIQKDVFLKYFKISKNVFKQEKSKI